MSHNPKSTKRGGGLALQVHLVTNRDAEKREKKKENAEKEA